MLFVYWVNYFLEMWFKTKGESSRYYHALIEDLSFRFKFNFF